MKKLVGLLTFFISFNSLATDEHIHRYERLSADEVVYQKQILEGILELQNANMENGKRMRGTHAKGSCLTGSLSIHNQALIDAGLPVVGLYKYPGTYKATIRFANAEGKIQSDWEKDVRSISVKVELPEILAVEAGAETQDYSMNNTPEFSIDSVEEFANLFTREKIGLFVKTIARGLKDKRRWDGEKFTELTFYSGTAYALGSEHVSKIAFKPCKQNFSDTAKLSKSNPNAFMDHVSSITKDKKACFGLWLQILNPQKIPQGFFSKSTAADYVEHSAKSWGEEESIWVKVGQLDFIDNKQISASACESLRFNINRNTFRDQRGIGNINRARTQAEKASAERR